MRKNRFQAVGGAAAPLLSLHTSLPCASFSPFHPPNEAMARKGPSHAHPDCTKSRTIGQQLKGREEKNEREGALKGRGASAGGGGGGGARPTALQKTKQRFWRVNGGGPGAGPPPRPDASRGVPARLRGRGPPGRGGPQRLSRFQNQTHVLSRSKVAGPEQGPAPDWPRTEATQGRARTLQRPGGVGWRPPEPEASPGAGAVAAAWRRARLIWVCGVGAAAVSGVLGSVCEERRGGSRV